MPITVAENVNAVVHRRTLLLSLAGLAAVSACIAGVVWLRSYCNPGYDPQSFAASDWAEADPERRGYMVGDLLATRRLVDMPEKTWAGALCGCGA